MCFYLHLMSVFLHFDCFFFFLLFWIHTNSRESLHKNLFLCYHTQKSALYTDIINLIWKTHTLFFSRGVSLNHKRARSKTKSHKRVARMEKFQKKVMKEHIHHFLFICRWIDAQRRSPKRKKLSFCWNSISRRLFETFPCTSDHQRFNKRAALVSVIYVLTRMMMAKKWRRERKKFIECVNISMPRVKNINKLTIMSVYIHEMWGKKNACNESHQLWYSSWHESDLNYLKINLLVCLSLFSRELRIKLLKTGSI